MQSKGEKVDTIEKLAIEMREGFKRTNEKIDEKIEQLAAITANGFRDVYGRIDGLEKKMDEGFKSVDVRFEQVNGKIDGIGRRIDSEVDQRIELGLRVEKVEAKVFPELKR